MPKLGSPFLKYETVPSTNELAKEMAGQGAPEGTTIIATEQTAGRGRQGRSWASAAGGGLYMSIILRPQTAPRRFAIMTLASGIAVAETLAREYGVVPDIKWPNDVMVSDRKICGILLETATEADKLAYAVLGIGVNLGQRGFPESIRGTATSLFLETGRRVEPEEFLWPLLDRLQRWYETTLMSPVQCLARWEQLSSYARGCHIRVITSGGGVIEGTTTGTSESGSLMVRLPDGQIREIVSGEISVRKLDDAARGLA